MSLAETPSIRELRARAVIVLAAAGLPGSPTIVQNPVTPTDADKLPEIHVFDGGRNSTSNSKQKLYRGNVILTIGVEVTVKMKSIYADILDELTDAVLQALITSDSLLEGTSGIVGYNSRAEFETAETPLARNVITVNMSSQEKFVTTNSGNPQALQSVKAIIKVGGDQVEDIEATFNPEQPD